MNKTISMKILLYFATLAFYFLGCGNNISNKDLNNTNTSDNQPHLRNETLITSENPLVFNLTFIKDDKNSFEQELDKWSKTLKHLEPNINSTLSKMGLPLEIEDLKLTDRLSSLFLVKFLVTDLDKYFQRICLSAKMRINDRGSNTESIFIRNLAKPNLANEQKQELSSQVKDALFPTVNIKEGKTWLSYNFEITFRKLLSDLFRESSLYLYYVYNDDKNKSAKPLLDQLDQLISKNPCQGIENILTKFVDANFSDLGKVTNIKCYEEHKEVGRAYSNQGDQLVAIGHLDFNVGGKSLQLINSERKQYLKPIPTSSLPSFEKEWPNPFSRMSSDIIKELLLMRFDRITK